MRLMVKLRAQCDATYQHAYHHKLRGRVWRALEDSKFDREHDNGHPLGLAFSNIFPWGDIQEGEQRSLLFASPREDLLATIARDLQRNQEFNVGEMAFEVDDLSQLSVDVGEPGTRGVIETATGVVVRLIPEHRERYGIDADYETATYWRPKHTIDPFKEAVHENLQHKHDRFAPGYRDGPTDVDGELFEGYDLLKTYALPVTVTNGTTAEILLSKWRFDYRVRNDTHRSHLNLALDAGIGGRNGLGFGFSNIVEKTKPGESELEVANAFA
ncbi:CRISPR-associated endoribonuclease Cas6 [Haloferax larsenii]|uniref:CRISPR-associated endoribonuclease Cas6 n=1 Tax=Haloferax larsenii TaxID=302484 RepID=A0A1H7Q3P3_HALLR|nr:CRISPR-associated endoribonuclease Cas6 [Haloferax larsenii]